MIVTYDNNLVTSFLAWFDNILSTKGQAFINASSLLYPIKSDYYSNYNIYSSPFRPWSYDNSVSGATVPTGVYDANGHFLTRASGIYFNFEKGWVGSLNPLAGPLSGNFSFREFDVFYTNEDEDIFLSQTKFVLKPKTAEQIPITGLAENESTFPCCAIKYDPGSNKDFAFGGMQNTISEFRALVVADSAFKIDAVLSIFRDTRLSNFSLISPTQFPFNSFGDYKNGLPFYYPNVISSDPSNYVWISDVDCMKLSDAAGVKVGQKVYTAMIDFTVQKPRYLKLKYNSTPDVIDGGTFLSPNKNYNGLVIGGGTF